jgi:beta-N-acetylhexosaminidase
MKLRTLLFILFLLLLTLGIGLGKYAFLPKYFAEHFPAIASPSPAPQTDAANSNPKIKNFLDNLTPRQKVAQLIAVPLTITAQKANPEVRVFLASQSAGVVTLFGENISSTSAQKALDEVDQATAPFDTKQLKPLIAVDHEGGTVQRLKGPGFTTLPAWNEWCEKPSSDRSVLKKSAQELSKLGVDIVFAPVVDVASQSTPLRSRACSANAQVTLDQAQVWIETFSTYGITSVIKHYPGIGSVDVDLHQKFATVPVSEEQEQVFQILLKNYPELSVMSTHTGVIGLSTGPCSLNERCLKKLNLGEGQLLFTDGLEMVAALYSEAGEPKAISQAAVEAIEAGNTVLVFGKSTSIQTVKNILDTLEAKYTSSPEFKEKVDRDVEKVILKKQKGSL